MKRNARTRIHAFTLIELLTVVAIIGILAGILIPVTAGVRRKARDARCLSNIRQIGTALGLYLADNKDRFPVLDWHSGDVWKKEGSLALGKYIFPDITDTARLQARVDAQLSCTVKTGKQATTWKYGYTHFLSRWVSNDDCYGFSFSNVTQPANHIYALCLANNGRWLDRNVIDGKPGDLRQAVPKPHNKRISVLYVDGHARFQKVSQLLKAQFTRDNPFHYQASDETTYVGNPAWDQ
ncbi:MAG: prepilin-type N-terminal cleavage/methylation domain-containing protein [Opitutaceae bacterium]|jgi:prepilin-type N-terminal cleavage/methylation domain-containing protein/prepilin-type processing-associated H-X9-DG protein|nr:prepilin-type N-terminal cleavage/methylation domain-containing protein [Opitutaceae bacterium]